MWRSGPLTRSRPVQLPHRLADNEKLLGWLYVGGRDQGEKSGQRREFPAEDHLTEL
jgi:hypothetical protein